MCKSACQFGISFSLPFNHQTFIMQQQNTLSCENELNLTTFLAITLKIVMYIIAG